jgi:predicted DNA-binding mobile mystery protein A
MDARLRDLRRRQLDRSLEGVRAVLPSAAPTGGWLKAIRESLGMSLEVFGRRLGLDRAGAFKLEKAEAGGAITLKRLRAAADALECDLAVVLLPRRPLTAMFQARAEEVARRQLEGVQHSMALEDQALTPTELEEMVQSAARDLIERGDRKLWT